MINLVIKWGSIALQTFVDPVKVLSEGRGVATGFAKEVMFYLNLLFFFAFVIAILAIIGSGDGNDKNKKTANWAWMLGFATIGLYIVRKLFLNF